MFVKNWMTANVYTVTPEESVIEVARLCKEKNIKHVPVVAKGRLKGIVSDRDIKEFSPSKATALDIYELHYLLAKTKVKDIMKTGVITTAPRTPIEEAAMVMYDRNVGCLPVLDGNTLVGIISDRDLFRALVDITGVRFDGYRIFLTIDDRPGSIREVADIVRKHEFLIQSILSSYDGVEAGKRDVILRTKGTGDYEGLKADLEKAYPGMDIQKS